MGRVVQEQRNIENLTGSTLLPMYIDSRVGRVVSVVELRRTQTMTSKHDSLDQVRKELQAMREVGIVTEKGLASSLRYVASHEDEVAEMLEYSSVSDVADSVASIASGCGSGGCE